MPTRLNFQLAKTSTRCATRCANFAQAEIAPRAAEIDKTDQFPRTCGEDGRSGRAGITVGEEYGGANWLLAHMIAMEDLRASASVGLSYGSHAPVVKNRSSQWHGRPTRKILAQADQR